MKLGTSNASVGGKHMKPIVQRIKKTYNYNLFHDTKGDIATLTEYCNMLADKINELNEELQKTKEEFKI